MGLLLIILIGISYKAVECTTTYFSINLKPKSNQCIYEYFPDNTLGKKIVYLTQFNNYSNC